MKYALWIVQVLLAVVFLFAGGSKLVMSAEEMTAQMKVPIPILFLRFIGVCEVLGAVALVLPGLLHTRRQLTPIAAAGLSIITVAATIVTLAGGDIGLALFPLVVAVLAAFVAYRRWQPAPRPQ
jgi:uncharacterized membrane protein YphA (DoxX/SURF4 family)